MRCLLLVAFATMAPLMASEPPAKVAAHPSTLKALVAEACALLAQREECDVLRKFSSDARVVDRMEKQIADIDARLNQIRLQHAKGGGGEFDPAKCPKAK